MAENADPYDGSNEVELETLSGAEKAAIFMLSIGEEHSSILFERMEDEEIRTLSLAMSSLGSIKSTLVEQLFLEFICIVKYGD